MRIGINALFQASGGSLIHLRQLLEDWGAMGALDTHDFVLFASRGTQDRLSQSLAPELRSKIEVVVLERSDRGFFSRFVVEQIVLLRQMARHKIELMFCPANTLPYAARIPCVVVFQNAAPFCPTVSRHSVGAWTWLRFAVLGLCMRLSAQRASRIIFISWYFRDLFVERFAFPATKGVVVYRARERFLADQSGAQRDIEQGYGIKRPYVLTVAHLYPYKNILELIEGFRLACQRHSSQNMQLVIVGRAQHAHYYQRIQALLGRLAIRAGEVLLTGEIPHEHVGSLLAGCEVYVFSSTCENCPTALIEALAMGLPIACSNLGVMPEIGGEAVLYFNPYDVKDIARGLGELLTNPDLRDQLRVKAIEQAHRFPDGAEVARQTLLILEQA